MVPCQRNRSQPKFASHFFALDMHMHRFITIETVKEKPIRAREIFDRGHVGEDNMGSMPRQSAFI